MLLNMLLSYIYSLFLSREFIRFTRVAKTNPNSDQDESRNGLCRTGSVVFLIHSSQWYVRDTYFLPKGTVLYTDR